MKPRQRLLINDSRDDKANLALSISPTAQVKKLSDLTVGQFAISLTIELGPRPSRTSALNDWLDVAGDSVTKPNRVRPMAPS